MPRILARICGARLLQVRRPDDSLYIGADVAKAFDQRRDQPRAPFPNSVMSFLLVGSMPSNLSALVSIDLMTLREEFRPNVRIEGGSLAVALLPRDTIGDDDTLLFRHLLGRPVETSRSRGIACPALASIWSSWTLVA